MKMMCAAIALLVASGASPALSQPRAPTLLTVTAESRVERAPDLAEISAGVVTNAETASAALAANSTQMQRVIAALRGARVAERDIQTSGLNLSPQYDYQNGRAPRLTGYQAQNTVAVRLRDLARVGEVVDRLVTAGSNQISGPNFRLGDEDAALDGARTAAVAKARARAELYARAAGLQVSRILRISEGAAEGPPRPIPMARMAVAASAAPVSAGEVALSASVTVEFELE